MATDFLHEADEISGHTIANFDPYVLKIVW